VAAGQRLVGIISKKNCAQKARIHRFMGAIRSASQLSPGRNLLLNGLARKSNHEDVKDRKESEVVSLRSLRSLRFAF